MWLKSHNGGQGYRYAYPPGVERGRHGLLIHNQISYHPFDAGNPLLQLGLLGFQLIPLEQC